MESAGEDAPAPAPLNRYKALLFLIYGLGIRSGKVTANPARLVKRRCQNNARVRWLTSEEGKRVRTIVRAGYPEHEPELDIALNTRL